MSQQSLTMLRIKVDTEWPRMNLQSTSILNKGKTKQELCRTNGEN